MLSEDLRDLATQYAEAWNAHNLDAIMQFHAPDTEYQLHGTTELVAGREAVASAFQRDLDSLPDVHFDLVALYGGRDQIVFQSRVTGTSSGVAFKADGIDLLTVRNGLVQSKHTYLAVPT